MKNLFFAIAVALSFIALGSAIQRHSAINAYQTRGVDTTARLVGSEVRGTWRPFRYYTYEFTDIQGQRQTFETWGDDGPRQSRAPDRERAVRYLSDDPSTFIQNRLGTGSLENTPTYWAIQKIILTLLACLFAFVGWRFYQLDAAEVRKYWARAAKAYRESDF